MDLLDELSARLLPGDGAMGTLLMDRGIARDRCFEELCVSEPDVINRIHTDYIAAGARIIETNTFGANAVRLARYGLENRVNEINWSAAQLAKEAAGGKQVYVAGSVGPLGITAEEASASGIDRAAVFQDQIGALLDGGARLILFETFTDLEELLIALEVKQSLHHCPSICSMVFSEDGRLGNGASIVEAFEKLRENGADICGVNCVTGPYAMTRVLRHVPLDFLVSAYPNAGYPRYFEGRYLYNDDPEYFGRATAEIVAQGARIVGGCCGTTPAHIAAITETLKQLQPTAEKTVVRVSSVPHPVTSHAVSEELSILDKLKTGRKVIVTELDPPKTLELSKFEAGAQELVDVGCDAITMADNSLAILRVSNLAVAARLKHNLGVTPLLHLSCRDRNLIGLQSYLLGMAALGMRHVLPLTGDPAKVGDHPGATSVYDVTSIELISIIKRLNEGFNYAGKSIKTSTRFVIGCTLNPNARNMEAQLSRLERKIKAGAQYVMTQPVFDPAIVDEMHRRVSGYGIPIFTGVWPLMNGRQTEFLHNEVPGIVIPDHVREAMRGLEGSKARECGIAFAKQVIDAVLDKFPGVYLITPFLNYELTVELTQYVRENE